LVQIVTLTCAGGSRAYSKRQERGIGKAGKVVEIFRCGFWKTVTPKLILGVPDVEIHMMVWSGCRWLMQMRQLPQQNSLYGVHTAAQAEGLAA